MLEGCSVAGMRLSDANGFAAAGVDVSFAGVKKLDVWFSFSFSTCLTGSLAFGASAGLPKLNSGIAGFVASAVFGVDAGCGGGRVRPANTFGCASLSCSTCGGRSGDSAPLFSPLAMPFDACLFHSGFCGDDSGVLIDKSPLACPKAGVGANVWPILPKLGAGADVVGAADCPNPPKPVEAGCEGGAVAPNVLPNIFEDVVGGAVADADAPNVFDVVVAGAGADAPKPPNADVDDCGACDVDAPNMLVAGCCCDEPKPLNAWLLGCDADWPNIFIVGGCTGCAPN